MKRRFALMGLFVGLTACASHSGLTPAQEEELAAWRRAAGEKIASKRYFPVDPGRPMPMMSGRVLVRLSVAENGGIYTPQVTRSSGEPLFDAAALTIVLSAAPLPPPPAFLLSEGDPVSLVVPVQFIPPGAPSPDL